MSETGSHPDGRGILRLLDGELSPQDAEEIRDHCETCQACRRTMDELASVGEALDGQPADEPLRPAWPEVRERLERADRPVFGPVFGLAAAAAVVAGIFLGLAIGSSGGGKVGAEGAYLWSAVGSSFAEGNENTLAGVWTSLSSEGEGRDR